jgi:hypothetical protein
MTSPTDASTSTGKAICIYSLEKLVHQGHSTKKLILDPVRLVPKGQASSSVESSAVSTPAAI